MRQLPPGRDEIILQVVFGTSLFGSDKKVMELLPEKLEALDILFPETKGTIIKPWKKFYLLCKVINSESNASDFYLDWY